MKRLKFNYMLFANAKRKILFGILILLCNLVTDAFTQTPAPPLKLGQSVVTTFDQTSDTVVRVYEIRKNRPAFIPPGTYWNAPLRNSGADWTNIKIGNVFGIALDDATSPNIFVSRSTVFCSDAYTLRPDSAIIYKLDGGNWSATTYIRVRNIPGPPQVNVNWIPNTGPGLGNLCYDNLHKQIFVTNHEDGKIYRIKDNAGNGQVKSFYDPFAPDNGTPGFAARGERLWGIGAYGTNTTDVRVYFSRWRFDQSQPNTPLQYNEIWSIALDVNGEFITSTVRKEIDIPKLADSTLSNPVADIEFAFSGAMLLAERTMAGDMGPCGNGGGAFSHRSRILEYPRNPNGSYTTLKITYVGLLDPNIASCGPLQNTLGSNGGVDFDYGMYDSVKNANSLCDSVIIGTGDALYRPGCAPFLYDIVYGLQLTGRSAGGSSGDYIDIDGVLDNVEAKTSSGDVDVYRKDLCTVNSCITILRDTIYCDSTGAYIYEFQIKNNSLTQYLEQLELTVDLPQPPNYVVAVPSTINISPSIPPGGASGNYKVKLIGPGAVAYSEVCYTLAAQFEHDDCPWCCYIENCIKLPLCGTCAEVIQDSIYCVNGQYYFNFTLQNGTQYNVTKIQLTSPGITPITFVPQIFPFGTPILPGQVFPNLTAQILGGAAGLAIPVKIKLFSGNFECCYFELTYILPPCGLRCDSTKICALTMCPEDSITVCLANSSSPYNILFTDKKKTDSHGCAYYDFPNAAFGVSYYIVLKTKNSLETWSATPQIINSDSCFVYDFTTDSSKAYGNNMVKINGVWTLISGDVNQDGVVDAADLALIDNAIFNFAYDELLDLNCDGVIDLSDISIAENSAYIFAAVIKPGPKPITNDKWQMVNGKE